MPSQASGAQPDCLPRYPNSLAVASGPEPRMFCLLLALDSFQVREALKYLTGYPLVLPPLVQPRAGVSHLYDDGRLHHFPVIQIECVMRAALLPGVLLGLQAAELVSPLPDRVPAVLPAHEALRVHCHIFRAPAGAAYAQFIRWRRLPARYSIRIGFKSSRPSLVRPEIPNYVATVSV